jgi:hypothetical protein
MFAHYLYQMHTAGAGERDLDWERRGRLRLAREVFNLAMADGFELVAIDRDTMWEYEWEASEAGLIRFDYRVREDGLIVLVWCDLKDAAQLVYSKLRETNYDDSELSFLDPAFTA